MKTAEEALTGAFVPEVVRIDQAETNWINAEPGSIDEGRALWQMCQALRVQIAELRAQIHDLGASDSALVDAIRELAESIDTIRNANAFRDQAFGRLSEAIERDGRTITEQQPAVRVRLNHTHTIKEGWRLSETTVEWCGPIGKLEGTELLAVGATVFNAGVREAALRNDANAVREDGAS